MVLQWLQIQVLGDQSASTSCERAFSYGGNILNIRRTRLTTNRAEKLILSAVRARNETRKKNPPPKIPSLGFVFNIHNSQ